MTYRKDLTNLALQERRFRNQRKADIAELHELQKERLEKASRDAKNPVASIFRCRTPNLQRPKSRPIPVTKTDLDFQTFLAAHRAEQKESQAA